MNLNTLQAMLGWCAIINIVLLLWWLFFITIARELTYAWHTKFFKISKDAFNSTHYAGLAFFKLMVFFFNIVPYIALRIVT